MPSVIYPVQNIALIRSAASPTITFHSLLCEETSHMG